MSGQGPGYGQKPVGLPPVVDQPPVPVRTAPTAGVWLTRMVLRPLWLARIEVGGLLVTGAVCGVLAWLLGWLPGVALVVAPWVVLLVVPRSRRSLRNALRREAVRRAWDQACRYGQVVNHSDRIPRVRRIAWTRAGEVLTVRLPRAMAVSDVEERAEHLAADFEAREVRVVRQVENARVPRVAIIRRDPFMPQSPGESYGLPWPWRDAPRVSVWNKTPIGIDENGETETLTLPGKNLLLGGEPESGKSSGMSPVISAGVLDATAHLWGLDAKKVELSLWGPVLDGLVTTDMEAAIELLRHLQHVMDDRYGLLEEQGRRRITRDDGLPPHMLIIDELRFFTAHEEKKTRDVFNGLLIDLIARGRAAGVIGVLATQKPSSDVVPTSIRDLVALRWAMRCSTRDASDTILGAGWASQGYDSSGIDMATRGVGYLLHEGTVPRMVKGFHLGDDDISSVVERGIQLRRGDGPNLRVVRQAA